MFRRATLVSLTALSVGAGCRDATAPWPAPPVPAPRIESITEWSVSEPELIQQGVFHYDDAKRLIRYDFGFVTSGTLTISYYAAYRYEGERIIGRDTYVRNGAFRQIGEFNFSYDAKGRHAATLWRELEGSTGVIREGTTTYEYDSRDRVSAIVSQGGERRLLSYDGVGNLVKEEVRDANGPGLVYTNTYERSFNPLAGAPPTSGVILVFDWGQGPYNMTGWTSQGVGLPVAATGSVTLELNAARYPVRRTHTATNVDAPSKPTVIVSTFEYVKE